MAKSKEFEQQLDFDVRARGSFTLHDDGTRDFSYQLEVFDGNKYIWIRRYDTNHGFPHFHVRNADGTEKNHIPMNMSYEEAHEEAQKQIFKLWKSHVRRYRRK